ncbi:MAG: tagaturonate reductase [Gemmataceae bacterium]
MSCAAAPGSMRPGTVVPPTVVPTRRCTTSVSASRCPLSDRPQAGQSGRFPLPQLHAKHLPRLRVAMSTLPETILQFGSGRFLRAFADLFLHQANQQGQAVGRVVIVQSTGDNRAGGLNRQGGRYHVLVRGIEQGQVVDRVEPCESISRALVASSQWDEVLKLACSPHLRAMLSNTTEKGYDLDPADGPNDAPPRSFPAKLLAVLRARFEAGQPPLLLIPCELRERQADILRQIVVDLARGWNLAPELITWITDRCDWRNTLVDRIVTGTPAEHPLLADDPMLTACEPYGLFAIEDRPGVPHLLEHPAVVWTPDVMPYFLRKVRLLNGGHTALLIKAWPRGFRTVRDAVSDPELGSWLQKLLFEEIVPVLEGRVDQPAEFAREVLDRFRNPFIDHKLADIALHHATKVQVRLVPTRDEYREKLGKEPALLNEVLAMPAPQV